jgi:2-polyprenyl-3-methyl-5-hydroxy-6-metoxy-1,4-benzoquinol methylase
MKKKILTFIIRGEKLLALHSEPHPEHGEGGWFVVTGGVEGNESLEEGVAREVMEETGLIVKESFFLNWGSVYDWGEEVCEESNFISFVEDGEVVLNEEHSKYEWLSIEDFIKKVRWDDDKNLLRKVLEKGMKKDKYFDKIEIKDYTGKDKYYFEKEEFSNPEFEFSFPFDEELLGEILIYKKSGKVLDLGCGQSGLSLALADRGFDVTCVDISKTAIDEISKEAVKRGIKINAICADLDEYVIVDDYDVVICTGTLHFVEKAKDLVEDIKKNTKDGGVNIVDVLTGDEFFDESEVKKIYSDWNIEDFESYREEWGIMNYLFAIKK